VAAADFFKGPYRCDLAQGELVRSVVLAPLGAHEGVGYATLQLARDSWALARSCAWVERDGDGVIENARVVRACIAPRPARQPAVEAALIGTRGEPDAVARALAGELENVVAVGDSHASAEYRVEMAREYAKRAIAQALAGTETEVAA
jgi:carbon-monoxide dehydrogenase medium subunit